ncbi:hypothetical protein V8G54_003062, partial [Vigna mungo]
KFVNEGCLKYEGEIETLCFDPNVWSYFVVVSVVKSVMQMVTLAHLNGRVHLYVVHNVSEAEVIHMIEFNVDEGGEEVAPFPEGIEEGGEGAQLPEGIEDGVRQELDEDAQLPEEVDGQRIEVVVGEAEEVDGERIEVEGDSTEVDRAEAGEVEVEADTIQVDRPEAADRIQAQDNEDGLVDIVVQCDVSESCSDLEVEVEPFLPGSDSDMDEDEINDCSWFNDEWQSEELNSPDNSDEDSVQEGYGHFSTFIQPKNMLDFN